LTRGNNLEGTIMKNKIIEAKASSIKRTMQKLLDDCDAEYEKLKQKLLKLSKECKHPKSKVTYFIDPAGDSSENYYRCNICGKRW